MAALNFTPISLYYSSTASAVPSAGNLINGELGLNIADMKLYAKNSSGVVTLLASSRTCWRNSNGLVFATLTSLKSGRGRRARTLDLRFWRPPLYQLSYTPSVRRPPHLRSPPHHLKS